MASFRAKFTVLQELFENNHKVQVALVPPPPLNGARVNPIPVGLFCAKSDRVGRFGPPPPPLSSLLL